MRFMNEMDIDEALQMARERRGLAEFLPYIQFLSDWRDIVNANSDGWPYWLGGVKAADRLITQVEQMVGHVRQWGAWQGTPRPKVEDMRKALAPIKGCATKHGWRAPELQPVQMRMEV